LAIAIFAALSCENTAARAAAFENIRKRRTRRAGVLLGDAAKRQSSRSGETDAGGCHIERIRMDAGCAAIYRESPSSGDTHARIRILPAMSRLAFGTICAAGQQACGWLAQEQLAMIDIEENAPEAAIETLQGIHERADCDSTCKQRALQVIVALGGPQMGAAAPAPQTDTVPALDETVTILPDPFR